MFINTRNSLVNTTITDEEPERGYGNRLSGWWGNDKATRFKMENKFHPVPGAAGFQLSNPSALDITSLSASLEIFEMAGGMAVLRERSKKLTAFLESALEALPEMTRSLFRVITPKDPEQRGAQLSLLLADGLLAPVMEELTERGVIVDERKPDVIRVAPAPLYNSFEDCVSFVEAFEAALRSPSKAKTE